MVTTRQQHKKKALLQMYDVRIDFDYASKMWNKNKKKVGCGQYMYICGCITKNGTACKKSPSKNKKYCHLHKNKKTIC